MGDIKIDYKKVQNITKLDLDSDVKMFKNGELHAEDLLAGGRPDIQALLDYAIKSGVPITKDVERAMSNPQMDVPQVSSSLFSGLLHITTGAVMNRLVHEAGRGNGLEVCRLIYQEWKNKSPQVMSTYRLAYENPLK